MRCSNADGNLARDYASYHFWVAIFGFVYTCGVPCLFYYLVRRFKDAGKRGDETVERAIGWMCECKEPSSFYVLCSPAAYVIYLFILITCNSGLAPPKMTDQPYTEGKEWHVPWSFLFEPSFYVLLA